MAAQRSLDHLIAPGLAEEASQLRAKRAESSDPLAVLVASSEELEAVRAELQRGRASVDPTKLGRRPS